MLLREVELLGWWDIAKALKIDGANSRLHDWILPWVNRNSEAAVLRCAQNKKVRLCSLLVLYWHHGLGLTNRADKAATVESFLHWVETASVKCWRGGGGEYDPAHERGATRGWDSYTLDPKRLVTFSVYDGTRGQKGYHVLPKRKEWWAVELVAPVDQLMLYVSHGGDEELIVPRSLSSQASQISELPVPAEDD